jgi:hypothetical protein
MSIEVSYLPLGGQPTQSFSLLSLAILSPITNEAHLARHVDVFCGAPE